MKAEFSKNEENSRAMGVNHGEAQDWFVIDIFLEEWSFQIVKDMLIFTVL